jgi:hypothetical protein
MAPSGWRSRTGALAASLMIVAIFAGSATAQTSRDAQAHTLWRKLSQTEVDCVDRALRARGSNLWGLIERGIGPSDPSAAKLRADCRARTTTSDPSRAVASTSRTSQAQGSQAQGLQTHEPSRESSRERLTAVDSTFARANERTGDVGSNRTAVRNAAAGHVQDEKVAADSMAIDPPAKVTVDRAAAAKPVPKKAAAGEPAPEKIVPDKVVVESADVVQIASIDKVAASKAATEQGTAEVVVPVVSTAARGVTLAAAERTKPETAKPPAAGETVRKETATAVAAATSTSVAAETRLSFAYGALSGLAAAGALVLLYFALQRKLALLYFALQRKWRARAA